MIKKAFTKRRTEICYCLLYFLVSISFITFYSLFIFDNSELYQYDNFPCSTKIITSEKRLVLFSYDRESLENSIEKINPDVLEDEYNYNLFKDSIYHTYKKTYNKNSKWKIKGCILKQNIRKLFTFKIRRR